MLHTHSRAPLAAIVLALALAILVALVPAMATVEDWSGRKSVMFFRYR